MLILQNRYKMKRTGTSLSLSENELDSDIEVDLTLDIKQHKNAKVSSNFTNSFNNMRTFNNKKSTITFLTTPRAERSDAQMTAQPSTVTNVKNGAGDNIVGGVDTVTTLLQNPTTNNNSNANNSNNTDGDNDNVGNEKNVDNQNYKNSKE